VGPKRKGGSEEEKRERNVMIPESKVAPGGENTGRAE